MEYNQSVAETRTQHILCWGRDAFGELGIESDADKNVTKPSLLSILRERVVQIACGRHHSVFLLENGLVYSCGSNESKQLGHDRPGAKPEKIELLETMSVKQIACGDAHTVVLNSVDKLLAFGDNKKGQLGPGTEAKYRQKPRIIKDFKPPLGNSFIVQVVCGGAHCLALASNGHIYSWGDNEYGQLGHQDQNNSLDTPTAIASLKELPICMIAAGESHSFALTVSGTLFGWGKNRSGQLGTGDETDKLIPVRVESLRSSFVRYVCCGGQHTVALTKDGRVFTFGDGSQGQLGHGGTEKAVNPRQVIELTGSAVTQVSCGRSHTLAHIESTGQLYAFGQNKFGELGDGTKQRQHTPSIVTSEWTKFQNSNSVPLAPTHMETDDHEDASYIYKIVSGGNQNFAIVEGLKSNLKPVDLRDFNQTNATTLFLTESKVDELIDICSQNPSKEDEKHALDFVATIFSSPACLNGSFLKKDDHENTGPKEHGLDVFPMRRSLIKLLAVKSISEKILSLWELLLHNMSISPPDIEAFRVFLILPELVIYEPPHNEVNFVAVFGQKILQMEDRAKLALCRWWAILPGTYFSRMIKAFKLCIEDGMREFPTPSTEKLNNVQVSLFVLNLLNKVNNEMNGIVPYDQFYIPTIQLKINITLDYRTSRQAPHAFAFSRFLFALDVKAKASLLETDAKAKMDIEVERTCRQFNSDGIIKSSPYLVIHVRRGQHLVQDTLNEIEKHLSFEFRKPLKVVFQGEVGIDYGGPRKEFFLLLVKEIFDTKYGMFVEMENSRTVWFNSQSFEDPQMYYLVGLICGLALYNSTIIDIYFPLVLYKKLLNQEMTLEDFRGFDPFYAQKLQYLLDYDGDVEDVFDQPFQVLERVYDETRYVDLMENGENILLNRENRKKYVELLINYKLNKSVENQFEEFKKGFYTVCDEGLLSSWHPQELMEMIAGCENYDDFMKLREVAEYEGVYYSGHHIIRNFWSILSEFDVDLRKRFLAFLTGSDKIPVHGIKSLKIKIVPLVPPGFTDQQDLLPVAQTCFNILCLPLYNTRILMEQKLKLALIEFSKGFGLA